VIDDTEIWIYAKGLICGPSSLLARKPTSQGGGS
jgi:hypothetical protein